MGDGADNDGDGLIDAADPDCSDPNDPREGALPAGSDGADNDGDLAIDHPFDPGCASALDDDEVDGTIPGADAGNDDSGLAKPDSDGGALVAGSAGPRMDPGGVPPPGGLAGQEGEARPPARPAAPRSGWSFGQAPSPWPGELALDGETGDSRQFGEP